jgi:hypothetical protein
MEALTYMVSSKVGREPEFWVFGGRVSRWQFFCVALVCVFHDPWMLDCWASGRRL